MTVDVSKSIDHRKNHLVVAYDVLAPRSVAAEVLHYVVMGGLANQPFDCTVYMPILTEYRIAATAGTGIDLKSIAWSVDFAHWRSEWFEEAGNHSKRLSVGYREYIRTSFPAFRIVRTSEWYLYTVGNCLSLRSPPALIYDNEPLLAAGDIRYTQLEFSYYERRARGDSGCL